MSLRLEWEQEPETLQLLERTLIHRYHSAKDLFSQGDYDMTVYLLGYVAEMVLKTAYFRFRRESITRDVKDMISFARRNGRSYIAGIADESYHSVLFWAELLRVERQATNRSLPSITDTYLATFSRTVYLNWWIEMRYHPNRVTRFDALEMLEATSWLFDNRAELGV